MSILIAQARSLLLGDNVNDKRKDKGSVFFNLNAAKDKSASSNGISLKEARSLFSQL